MAPRFVVAKAPAAQAKRDDPGQHRAVQDVEVAVRDEAGEKRGGEGIPGAGGVDGSMAKPGSSPSSIESSHRQPRLPRVTAISSRAGVPEGAGGLDEVATVALEEAHLVFGELDDVGPGKPERDALARRTGIRPECETKVGVEN